MVTLPPWANGLLLLGATALAAWRVGRLQRRHPELTVETALRRARHLWAAPVIIIAAFGVHTWLNGRPDLWWSLPSWVEARYLLALWIVLLGAMTYVFAFATVLAVRTRHAERGKMVVAVLLALGAVQVMVWRTQRPIAPTLGAQVDADGVVLQTSGVSCVAASAANMLRRRGAATDERAMAVRLNTTAMGTTAGQAEAVLRGLGHDCRKVELDGPAGLHPPAMLMIDHARAGPESHAVSYMGAAGGRHEIWDPLDGRRLMTAAELGAVWRGRAIDCRW